MPDKIRIAAIEAKHMHVFDLMRQALQCEQAEFVGFADPDEANRQRAKTQLGLSDDLIFADHRQLLDQQKPQAVMICSTNAMHDDFVMECAARGIHCMVEKPFAARLIEVDRMIRACERAGVKLMCNFPSAWSAALRHARTLCDEGRIGRIFQITYRGGHAGPVRDLNTWWYRPEDGGGVLLDYCCYGANVSTWFLRKLPRLVTALAGTLAKPVKAEDNAVMLALYDDALCIFQATWTRPVPEPSYGPVINGLEGAITVVSGSQLRLFTPANSAAGGELIEAPPLPPGRRNGPEYFVNAILRDTPIEDPCSPQMNRDVQEILEAGMLSVQSGCATRLPLFATG